MPHISVFVEPEELFSDVDSIDLVEELKRRDFFLSYAQRMYDEFSGKDAPAVVREFVHEMTGRIL